MIDEQKKEDDISEDDSNEQQSIIEDDISKDDNIYIKVLKNLNLTNIIFSFLDKISYKIYKKAISYNNKLSGNKEKKLTIFKYFGDDSIKLLSKIKNIRKIIFKDYTKFLPLIKEIKKKNISEVEIKNDSIECDCLKILKNLKSLKLQCKNFTGIDKINYIKILNLSNSNLSNLDYDSFKYLHLTELYLNNNKLSDVSFLKRCDFPELKILNLAKNKFTNISFLKICDFPLLSELYLNENKISDISALLKCKFLQLKILNLNENRISNCLENVKDFDFPVLDELYLGANGLKFNDNTSIALQIRVLYLSNNKFNSLNFIRNFYLPLLNKLYLTNNSITNIQILKDCNFKNLEELHLGMNKIDDIKVLEKCKFPEIKKLILCSNNIGDISVIQRCKFQKLEVLDLEGNNNINNENNYKMLENYNFDFKL